MIIDDHIESLEIVDHSVISNRKLVVTGQIKVAVSGSLTIENSELAFEKGAGMVCAGPVRFSNSTFAACNANGRWDGISLTENGAGGSLIEKCVFSGAGCSDSEPDMRGALTVLTVEDSPVKIIGCTFSDCRGNFGGGLCVRGTLMPGETQIPGVSVVIEGCRFENCAGTNGGALALIYRARVEASECRFHNCEGKSGGAVYLYDNSFLTATNCSFENCRAEVSGGAVTSRFSTLNLNRSTFKNCVGTRNDTQGGACYLEKSNCRLADDQFVDCQAQAGGALRPVGGLLKLDRCEYENCVAAVAGGAIAFSRDCESKINGCVFNGCSKKSPTGVGNIIAFQNSSGDLNNCIFSTSQSNDIAQDVSFGPDSSVTMVNCNYPKKTIWESIQNLFNGS